MLVGTVDGSGALHLALLLEEMGRRLVPVPLLGATLAARAILAAGDPAQQARWLPGLASGELPISIAWLPPVVERVALWARRAGSRPAPIRSTAP